MKNVSYGETDYSKLADNYIEKGEVVEEKEIDPKIFEKKKKDVNKKYDAFIVSLNELYDYKPQKEFNDALISAETIKHCLN